MTNDLIPLIVDVASQLQQRDHIDPVESLQGGSALFGDGGGLDSVDLVSLIVAVEQAIEEKYGVNIELADEKALSQTQSPYRTIATLAEYAAAELGHRWPS